MALSGIGPVDPVSGLQGYSMGRGSSQPCSLAVTLRLREGGAQRPSLGSSSGKSRKGDVRGPGRLPQFPHM